MVIGQLVCDADEVLIFFIQIYFKWTYSSCQLVNKFRGFVSDITKSDEEYLSLPRGMYDDVLIGVSLRTSQIA